MSRFSQVSEADPMHIQVANAIRGAIVRGDLGVGERLPLEEIGKEFGVSRMPVREALIRLEKEGLVTFLNRRGAVVAGITEAQFEDVTHLRSILETDALRIAVKNYTADDISSAREVLNDARNLSDPNLLADAHWKFHDVLYHPCGRRVQLEMIHTLHANVDRFFRQEWREVGLRAQWIEEHESILQALEGGRTEDAVDIVESHIQAAADRVKVLISKTSE